MLRNTRWHVSTRCTVHFLDHKITKKKHKWGTKSNTERMLVYGMRRWSIVFSLCMSMRGFPIGWAVKNLPAVQDMWVLSLCEENPMEKEMAAHSSILPWEIPWTEKQSGLQSTGLQTVGHWLTKQQKPAPVASTWIPSVSLNKCLFKIYSSEHCLSSVEMPGFLVAGTHLKILPSS